MKKILLSTTIAVSLCMPVYAEQFTADTKHAADFPVFGNENQTLANMGLENSLINSTTELKIKRNKESENYKLANQSDNEIDLETGRVKRDWAKKNLSESDSDYVPEIPKITEKNHKKVDTTKLPVQLTGDHIELENESGDFVATGKVRISQGAETLLTSYAFGNMKSGDVYLLEGGTVLEPGNRTEAKWVHYNYNNKTGELKEIKGRGNKDLFKAPHALIMPDKILADQGGFSTRCTAQKHTPCMHIEAKTLEFYPQEKMVAHNVKCFIKGKHIYSRKLWINEFDGERKSIITPRIGWDGKDNGWFFKVEYENNLTAKDKIKADIYQYSRSGYKPQYKYQHYEKNWDFSYMNSWEEDSDNWYHKENDFKLSYKPHHLIKGIPLTISGDFEYGLWSQWNARDNKTKILKRNGLNVGTKSWHREYKYYINHDPIKIFGPDTTLHLTYGRKWVHESASGENRITNMYYQTLRQKLGRNINLWISNLREKKKDSMFDLGQPDMEREFRIGMQYKAGANDTLSVVNRYDYGKNKQYETIYTWYHRFCCWALQLSYEKNWHAYEYGKKDSHDVKVQFFFYNW